MTAQKILGNWIVRLRLLIRALSKNTADQLTAKVRRRRTRVFFDMP